MQSGVPHPEPAILRLLDRNANRAREALRVIEEFARGVMNDAHLTRTAKELRHQLVAIIQQSVPTGLIHSRDITGDVGTAITATGEYHRPTPAAVVSASFARLTEALRTLEEYGKLITPAFATRIEQLRYTAYDLERSFLITLSARNTTAHWKLYVILTESLCSADWFTTAQAVLQNGANVLQLREKNLPDAELLRRANQLRSLCRDHNATFILNDRPDIALAAQADGVHVGQDDLPVASIRQLAGNRLLIGLSTHASPQITAALTLAPDYIAVGPMFDTATKPQNLIAGPALLIAAAQQTSLPIVAIGGINQNTLPAVLAAHPRACLCVCSAIISHPDPATQTRALLQQIEEFQHNQSPTQRATT